MLTRAAVVIVVLALAAPAPAQLFDLDARIRARPDGRLVLPGPFDTDAKLSIAADGVLAGCEAAYAFCEPAPVSCAEPPCCGEHHPAPGETLRVGRPALPGHLPRLVDVDVMSGGSCYGEAQQEAEVLYFDLGNLANGPGAGPPDDCFWCSVALWLWSVGFVDECPALECVENGDFAAYMCALFSHGSFDAAGALHAVRPRAIGATPTATLRSLRDGVLAPTPAAAGRA